MKIYRRHRWDGDYATAVRLQRQLRERVRFRPLFVPPGHLVDTASSRRIVLACATRYRLPEPTRLADRLAGEAKRGG